MPKEFDPAVTAYVRANLPARLSHSQSLKQQAATIGVSDAQLYDVLNGTGTIGKGTLPRFASALGLSVESLVQEARAAAARLPAVQDASPELSDTLSMADSAARDLTALDGVPPPRAWAVMRNIRLANPTARDFYFEARQRLAQPLRSVKGEELAGAGSLSVDRQATARRKSKKLFKGADNSERAERGRAQK